MWRMARVRPGIKGQPTGFEQPMRKIRKEKEGFPNE
jgi:hypothetical protein